MLLSSDLSNNQTNISALCRADIYPLLSHSYFYFIFIKLYIYNNVHIAYALVHSGLKTVVGLMFRLENRLTL